MFAGLPGVILLTTITTSCSSPTPVPGAGADQRPASGSWSAWLEGPGGEVPFILDLVHEDDRIHAWIATGGGERIEIPEVSREGEQLCLAMDDGGSRIRAVMDSEGKRLSGEWTAHDGSSLVFVAEAGLPCVPGGRASGGEAPAPELAGIYRMTLPSGDNAAAGTFSVEANGHAHGELTTGTGEFVALRGGVTGTLMLSGFDGLHACVLRAGCTRQATFGRTSDHQNTRR